MAPARKSTTERVQSDREKRKPLVEKKRRARINESLQELRVLISDPDIHSKMENAEVLEVTVKQVETILHNRTQEVDAFKREASERFAAGYIQCMHDVHTFVSSSPGMDPAVAAELLNHLLESMPLNDELREKLGEPGEDGANSLACSSTGFLGSPALFTTSPDELSSDMDETDSEHGQVSSEEADTQQGPSAVLTCSNPLWRPCW
ncbi:transcription cofactor HES-6 [Nothobranchius furzeri]